MDDKMRNQNTTKKKYKLNPAEINFMPNPQFLIDNMENVDDLAESTDVNLGMRTIEEQHETTTSDNEEGESIERKEELIIKSGNFKFLNMKERKKFICAKCDEQAVVQRVATGEDYCYRHCMKRVLRKIDLLTNSEKMKKEYLESFKIKIEETKTDLEKTKSALNNSRISSQEVNTQNLHNINLLFKHLFEETKHLYSCFLDQIGKKISECESIHIESTELMQYLASELQVIDSDIDRNYDDIILNMEFEPFKAIMNSYYGKVNDNLSGIDKVKRDLSKVSISKIEIKEKFFSKEHKLDKVLGSDLFDIVNRMLREDGETLTEETVMTTERFVTSDTNRSRMLNESSSKKEVDEFMFIKRINTKNLRKEAEKIIVDLNNVIDQLEGKKAKAPKTPTMKNSRSRLSYLATKKGVTSTKKSKLWKKSNSRNSSVGSRKKTKSDKKMRTSKNSPFKNSNSKTKLNSIFSNHISSAHHGLLNRNLSDVARLESILKRNSRTEKYGYNKHLNEGAKTNYTAFFDAFRQRSSSGSNKSKNSRGYFQDRGLFEYFRFPQNQRSSYTQHHHLLKSKGSTTSRQFYKNSNRYFQNRHKGDIFDKKTKKVLFGGNSPERSTSRNMRDTRYSNKSYGVQRNFSYGNKIGKETQTRKFLKEMIKDIEKGRKNPFFFDDRKGSADVINALKIGGKKYGFVGKSKHLPNWDMFKRASKRAMS